MPVHDNVIASAVRRLNLERDSVDSDSTMAGPTTRQQWCQQWLHRESAKRRASEPNTVKLYNILVYKLLLYENDFRWLFCFNSVPLLLVIYNMT